MTAASINPSGSTPQPTPAITSFQEPIDVIKAGAMIWTAFPFAEFPIDPGPKQHIAYILQIRENEKTGDRYAVALYTTSQIGKGPPRLGDVDVTGNEAAACRQKPFRIQGNRIGFLPIDNVFFPRLRNPNRGVICQAPESLQDRVLDALALMMQRQDLIQTMGPLAPPPVHDAKQREAPPHQRPAFRSTRRSSGWER
jgi:hypothetical protein